MASATSLAGGAMLGLASSLHCISMCGGISLLFGFSGSNCGAAIASREQALLHGGRITSYMTLGAIAGGFGSVAFSSLDPGNGQLLLRWAAAISLGWIGLVTAGIAPAPAFLGHTALPGRWRTRLMLQLPVPARRIVGGMIWGLFPCSMVYGALLFAMFTGTAIGGALVMLGFGLGTLPALAVAGLGFRQIQAALRIHGAAKWLGALMVLLALLSLVESPAALGTYCAQLAGSFGG